jgi:mono/diheme cytochrome c family protein
MVMRYMLAATAIAAAGVSVAETPVERGVYLVQGPMGCGNCHSPKGPDGPIPGMDLAGFLVLDDAGMKAYAKNITPGGEVAGWSDAELGRAIREGIRPDGSLIGPPMPFTFYAYISDSDLAAIVAYLRTVPAVQNSVPDSVYDFPLPPAYGPPIKSVPDVPRGETVEYGHYLVNLAHCLECHTPMGPQGPMIDTDLGRGGFVFRGPWGEVTAPNIMSLPPDPGLGVIVLSGKRIRDEQTAPTPLHRRVQGAGRCPALGAGGHPDQRRAGTGRDAVAA